jgi:hypothetical protein
MVTAATPMILMETYVYVNYANCHLLCDLLQFIASEMQKERLDLDNEDNLDGYLNTKFM